MDCDCDHGHGLNFETLMVFLMSMIMMKYELERIGLVSLLLEQCHSAALLPDLSSYVRVKSRQHSQDERG